MDQGGLMQYVVPVGGRGVGPGRPARGGGGGGGGKNPTTLLLVMITVLVILIIFLVARRRWLYRAKPRCGRYSGHSARACTSLAQVCGGNEGCLNAVAHCMPLVDRLGASASSGAAATTGLLPLQELDGPGLGACADAIARMDPAYAAHLAVLAGGGKACVPPDMAPLVADPRDQRAAAHVMEALAPLMPFSLAVAGHLPTCPPAH